MSEKQLDRLIGCLLGFAIALGIFATIGLLDQKGMLDPLLDYLGVPK